MRCPHCRAECPRHRRGPHGGHCAECRRLFVTDRRVAYTAFPAEFLRERVAAVGRDGALRVTSLQLQHDVRRKRPYPPEGRAVPVFVLWLMGRPPRDARKVVLTPSAFTVLARTVVTDLVDEHGAAPPPAPEPVRFAVLCPDPAVAACLWANEVGERLGGLVVTAGEDLPRATPVLDLSDATPADRPADLLAAVLRFGVRHLDAGRTGFLTWPGDG